MNVKKTYRQQCVQELNLQDHKSSLQNRKDRFSKLFKAPKQGGEAYLRFNAAVLVQLQLNENSSRLPK